MASFYSWKPFVLRCITEQTVPRDFSESAAPFLVELECCAFLIRGSRVVDKTNREVTADVTNWWATNLKHAVSEGWKCNSLTYSIHDLFEL